MLMFSPHLIRWQQGIAYCSSGLPGHSEASSTNLIISDSSWVLSIWWGWSFSIRHDSETFFPSTYTDQLLSSCSSTDLVAWTTSLGPFSILPYWAAYSEYHLHGVHEVHLDVIFMYTLTKQSWSMGKLLSWFLFLFLLLFFLCSIKFLLSFSFFTSFSFAFIFFTSSKLVATRPIAFNASGGRGGSLISGRRWVIVLANVVTGTIFTVLEKLFWGFFSAASGCISFSHLL